MIEQVGISTEQSVAVVIEVAKLLHEWSTLGRSRALLVPGIRDIRLERGGATSWHTGHTLPARAVIPAMGALLTALLRSNGAGSSVPAGLMYILVRSTHDPSLAPFVGLEELIAALGRYAPLSTAAALDSLLAKYTIARTGLPAIDETSTVSDLRRMRRAGGVALTRIAEDTGIPLSLLRELEWGVYVNWPEVHADSSIRAYASRAGLDPDLAMAVIARERAEAEEMPVAVRPAARGTTERPLPQRLLPWAAIGALALGALFVGAGDRSPEPLAVAPVPAHAVTVQRPALTPPPQPTVVPPAAPTEAQPVPQSPLAVPATPKTDRPVKPSRATNRTSSAARRAPLQVTRASHPIMWLARTLAGDGRFAVQPFPKPQGQ